MNNVIWGWVWLVGFTVLYSIFFGTHCFFAKCMSSMNYNWNSKFLLNWDFVSFLNSWILNRVCPKNSGLVWTWGEVRTSIHCTRIKARQSLFPSTRHQSFNQFKHKDLSKKGFRSFQRRRDLQIKIIARPMPSIPSPSPSHWNQPQPMTSQSHQLDLTLPTRSR